MHHRCTHSKKHIYDIVFHQAWVHHVEDHIVCHSLFTSHMLYAVQKHLPNTLEYTPFILILFLLVFSSHRNKIDSSFAENFYGLKRVRLTLPPHIAATLPPSTLSTRVFSDSKSNYRPLSSLDRSRTLFFLTLVPYIKTRMDTLYTCWRDGVDEEGYEMADVETMVRTRNRE